MIDLQIFVKFNTIRQNCARTGKIEPFNIFSEFLSNNKNKQLRNYGFMRNNYNYKE